MTMDIKIICDLIILCSRRSPTSYHKCDSVILNGYQIKDMLSETQLNDMCDSWGMTDTTGEKERDYVLTFDVDFSGPDEISDVKLNGKSMIDCVGPVMDAELIEQARIDFISDQADRAYEEYRDRKLEGSL